MQRPLLALFLVTALLPAVQAQSDSPCLQVRTDPAGDTQVPAGIPAFDTKPADFLGVELAWLDEGASLTVHLNGDPHVSGAGPLTYSYWVGFEDGGKSAGGNPPTWTFQGSTSYDRIETMYWDGPQDYPVVWNGTTFSFMVPWSSFQEAYGSAWPVEFGNPFASSGGPSAGLNNPSEDSVYSGSDVQPLQPCPKATATPTDAGAVSASGTGKPGGGASGSSGGTGGAQGGSTGPGGPGQAGGNPASSPGQASDGHAPPVAGASGSRANSPQANATPAPVAALVAFTLLGLASLRRR